MPNGHVMEGKEVFLVVRTRTILACVLHWTLFCSVVVLVITGLYIADPNYYFGRGEAYQAFAMANMRFYHFAAATGMIVSMLLRFYLAFTEANNKDIKQFVPTPWNVVNALKLAKYFLTLRGESAHYRFVNPLGGIGIFLMAAFLFVQVITGFLLYLPAESNNIWWGIGYSVNLALGGQQNVRLIHHTVMYLLIFVIFIHVYMQIWKNIVFSESDISSIIAGYKLFPLSQIGHFADHYGLHRGDAPPDEKVMKKASVPMREEPE